MTVSKTATSTGLRSSYLNFVKALAVEGAAEHHQFTECSFCKKLDVIGRREGVDCRGVSWDCGKLGDRLNSSLAVRVKDYQTQDVLGLYPNG